MIYVHRDLIREAISMTLNSTYKLDLPETGKLAGILLRISGSDVSGLGQTALKWRIIDFINKIEVIANGSTTIKSFKGDMAQALGYLDHGAVAPDQWKNYATNTQWCIIPISFGRSLFDRDMFLDLSQYASCELWITNDATSSNFSDLTVTVIGYFLRPEELVGSPLGYIRSEEWRNWTTVADETKYHDLPTELMIRRIALQLIPGVDANNVENTAMWNLADDVGLYLRTGTIEVWKGGIDDLLFQSVYEQGGHVLTSGVPYMNADYGVNMGVGYVNGIAGMAGAQDGAGAATIPTFESGRTSFTQKPETYEADSPISLMVKGVAYHNTIPFRFDHDRNPSEWLNPDSERVVQLNIHTRNASSAASATAKIILDRLVS